MSGAWIQTFGGGKFDILEPDPRMVQPFAMAMALSKLCRFTGHSEGFYAVSTHSKLVADLLPERLRPYGLLHDAHEYVITDWSTPLKRALTTICPPFKNVMHQLEEPIKRTIHHAFGLDWLLTAEDKALIKQADWLALAAEKRDLMPWSGDWSEWNLPEPPVLKARALEWPLAFAEYREALITEHAAGRLKIPGMIRVANDNASSPPSQLEGGIVTAAEAALAVDAARKREAEKTAANEDNPAPLVGGRREEH